ncbi:hypothetical protein ACFSBZ_07190 [Amnibacterium flavum]|uniref:Integral membrane protein n=1 Tax=Amnibacterium flavum TaxID=2173173 RepID=A0A2V1HU06_9MICO|nr:hypothetical protein [Amnibacterium flavum]PVZ93787.1 hypothetical protein DDQ50_08310 [Amnibacterium flavum]
MELLFVSLGGALLGLLARYTLPRRQTNGVVLVPAIGAAAAGVIWVALTWLGLAWDQGLIWWITLALAAATVAAAALLIGRARERHDAARLSELSRGRVAV